MNSAFRRFLDVIEAIFAVIAIILIIITISLIFVKIFGNSPEDNTIIFSALGIIATLLAIVISTQFKVMADIGGLKEFKRQMTDFKEQTVGKIIEIEKKVWKK